MLGTAGRQRAGQDRICVAPRSDDSRSGTLWTAMRSRSIRSGMVNDMQAPLSASLPPENASEGLLASGQSDAVRRVECTTQSQISPRRCRRNRGARPSCPSDFNGERTVVMTHDIVPEPTPWPRMPSHSVRRPMRWPERCAASCAASAWACKGREGCDASRTIFTPEYGRIRGGASRPHHAAYRDRALDGNAATVTLTAAVTTRVDHTKPGCRLGPVKRWTESGMVMHGYIDSASPKPLHTG